MRRRNFQVLIFAGIVLAGICTILGSGGGGGGGTEYVPVPGGTATAAASATCMQCHAKNVAPVYKDAAGVAVPGSPTIVAEYQFSKHYNNDSASCASCHKPATGHGSTNTQAIVNPDATANAAGTGNICYECHAGQGLPHVNPNITTTAFVGAEAAQYVDLALTTYTAAGCKSCHNPHDTTSRKAILADYSQNSGHGDVHGEGWIHYRWKGSDRATCARCHTTSSFVEYITKGPAAYVPPVYPATDNTKQTLYCLGCHTDYSYKVRSIGAVTATYSNGATVTFPNIGKSNLCMNCHVGRENGDSIKNSAANFATSQGFVNSHYLTGGATVYGTSGYEYATKDYTNVAYFEHDKIGTAAFPATGSGGPCVGCHMTPARHTFKPVALNKATEQITSIVSTACAACHTGGYALTVAGLNTEREDLDAALAALNAVLAGKGLYFAPANPYFFTGAYDPTYVEANQTTHCQKNLAVRNWQYGGTTTYTWNGTSCVAAVSGGDAGTAKDTMGAAFNLNMLAHDFGAFAHNSIYVKRLIWDSIDYMDDKLLNNSVNATINALPTSDPVPQKNLTAAQKTAAIAYLGGRP
jgi:nitrate/TMAO reductase-like tetraheme cytochrome c subunit